MLITNIELIKQSWNLQWKNFSMFVNAFIALIIANILPVIGMYAYLNDFPLPLIVAVFVVALLASLYLSVLFYKICDQIVHHHEIKWNELYKNAYTKVGIFFFVSFVTGLIILGGLILLLIPGIIFATWYAFAPIIAVTSKEKITLKAALAESKALSQGRWWQTTLRLIIPQLAFGIFAMFIATVISALATSIAGYNSEVINTTSLAVDILSTSLMSLLTPLTIFPLVLLLKSLKETKA